MSWMYVIVIVIFVIIFLTTTNTENMGKIIENFFNETFGSSL